MPGIEIAGQVIGVMAMALIVLSFQCKKRAGFYVMQMSGNVLFAVSFLMLGNVGASLMNLMGVFRAIILLLPERRRKIWHLVLINLLFVGGAVFAGTVGGDGWACLVSFAAQTAGTFSLWYGSDRAVRWVQLCIISPLWITNNTVFTTPPAIGGIICEAFCMVSTIVYLVRMKIEEKKLQGACQTQENDV